MTGQSVYPNPNYMEILNPELFKYPYAYIVEPGQMYISIYCAAAFFTWMTSGVFSSLEMP